ncbi:MAG: CooT family nickel-binding protein [Deltaproteobacteria bacterium]|mgnify:CR=1 FL=1|nr:CooT family nickel-binding protein [Deltaproteobacteria bacterium]MBW2084204.1 CooT family nickel-binding protein [Deltaproteobacteria bacterium]HDM10707.1 CooT family nickel-binding protein [Desulfobacteraceae bacterium]
MCESALYLVDKEGEKLIMENVELIEAENGKLSVVDLFGERKEIKGRVKSLSLVDHKILVEPLP